MSEPAAERYVSMDAVRGFAVLGILLMNIVGMGLPIFAYVDPTYWGGSEGADRAVWAVNYVFTDGKMRALFTMLFGASLMLIAGGAEGRTPGPWQTHYRRIFWLFVIGMIHAYFLWTGDILVPYAVAGALVFPLRKLKARWLIGLGALILIALLTRTLLELEHTKALQAAALAPGASAADLAAWKQAGFLLRPPIEMGQAEVVGFQGGFLQALKARADITWLMQTQIIPPDGLPEAVGQMLIGMGLFQLGFFTLKWPTRAYGAVIAAGYLIGLPLMAWLCWKTVEANFEPVARQTYLDWTAVSRPFIALAHASVLMLIVRAGWLSVLVNRLAAAGRMALSNYLMSSILTTLVFCGFGLGLYGELQRAELYWFVVAPIWAFILIWSKPWMDRFNYGPFEWVWRSLVRWKVQPFAKPAASPAPAAAE